MALRSSIREVAPRRSQGSVHFAHGSDDEDEGDGDEDEEGAKEKVFLAAPQVSLQGPAVAGKLASPQVLLESGPTRLRVSSSRAPEDPRTRLSSAFQPKSRVSGTSRASVALEELVEPATGRDALREVAADAGAWDWVFVGPDAVDLPLVAGGTGSVEAMRECLGGHTKYAVIFGLLRLSVGTGSMRRIRHVFIIASNEEGETQKTAVEIGRAMLCRGDMEKVVAKVSHFVATVTVKRASDLTIDEVVANVEQKVIVDHSRDEFDEGPCLNGRQSVRARRSTFGDSAALAAKDSEIERLVQLALREELKAEEAHSPTLAEEIAKLVPPGPRVCVLGGTQFQDPDTEDLVTAVARRLRQQDEAAGERIVVLTGGMPGVQAAFARAFGDSDSLIHLLPEGQASGYRVGRDVRCGATLDERMQVFGQLGQVYLSFEGGPGVAREARAAFDRGALVLPMICTGGASGGMFDFPAEALERPECASEDQWLCFTENEFTEQTAQAVVDVISASCQGLAAQAPSGDDGSALAWADEAEEEEQEESRLARLQSESDELRGEVRAAIVRMSSREKLPQAPCKDILSGCVDDEEDQEVGLSFLLGPTLPKSKIQQAPPEEPAPLTGLLLKQASDFFARWQLRVFEVSGGKVRYWLDVQSHRALYKPKYEYSLLNATVAVSSQTGNSRFRLTLKTDWDKPTQRPAYQLMSDISGHADQSDRDEHGRTRDAWVEALQEHAEFAKRDLVFRSASKAFDKDFLALPFGM